MHKIGIALISNDISKGMQKQMKGTDHPTLFSAIHDHLAHTSTTWCITPQSPVYKSVQNSLTYV